VNGSTYYFNDGLGNPPITVTLNNGDYTATLYDTRYDTAGASYNFTISCSPPPPPPPAGNCNSYRAPYSGFFFYTDCYGNSTASYIDGGGTICAQYAENMYLAFGGNCSDYEQV
jgi:hypothetical protein